MTAVQTGVQSVSALLLQGFADQLSGISLDSLADAVAPFCLATQTEKHFKIVGQIDSPPL